MKKISFLFFVASIALSSKAQEGRNFQKKWQAVDSMLSKESLPKTALDKVNTIYADAVRLNLPDEKIKAIIYRLSIEQTIKDNDVNTRISEVEKQIAQSSNSVEKSLLQTLEAQLLIGYLNENRWNILNRKETVNYTKTDIAAWSADDFALRIHQLFESALSNEKVKTTPNKDFSAIVIKGNVTKLRPTLYDLVAHFALDYYKTNPSTNTKPVDEFQLNQTETLSNAQTFIHYPFTTKDTLSAQYQAVRLFQKILQFHINDENKSAFVDADIERIDWCYNNLIFDNKDSLYLSALKNISSNYPNLPETKQAAYLQAQYYSNNASGYNAYGDTTHRYDYAKAMEIISQNIDTKDTSEGLINLLQLKNSITQKSLNIQIESINSPNLPMRTLFNYKNVSKVYLRVLKINRNMNLNLGDSAYWATLIRYKNIVAHSEQQLPSNNDYQSHSAELKIDALPVGSYILLASDSDNFSTNSKLSSVNFDVSALSYISNADDYFVLNRETGKPIESVKVNFTKDTKGKTKIIKTLVTDNNGYFKKPKGTDDENYDGGHIIKNNDTIDFSANYSYNYSRNNDDDDESAVEYEEDKAQIYFYTDRGIYRPGQKIYYKGIALTKDKTTHNDKLWQTKDSLHIYLKDVNNKIVDSAVQFVNDYSSFAGTFNIPQNVLTGNFSIDADDVNGRTNFRVEEYKRPTFYAGFDTLKSQYKLNDSITVTGFAKAYAGNNVDGAQVKVNVERTARFPYPWLYGRIYPRSSSKEIFNDTVTTDENGKFTIRFKASPDSSVDKKTEPIFNYNISVEVTDNNGETREAQKNISVGYKNMVINIQNAELMNIDTLKKIYVSTQNLEGEAVPSDITVRIAPLQSPQRLIRKRFWNRPDQFVMDKETYLKDFPYDEYDNETDKTSWQKSDVVYNQTMNDSLQNGFDIQNNHLQNGWYYVEATAKDKEGNEVKDVKYIRVINYAVAQNEYLFGNNKTPYIKTGDTDSLTIGSGAKDVYMIQSFVKNDFKGNSTTTYSNFNIDAAQKLITYKTTDSDKYGVAYGFAFVKNNRFYNDFENLNITEPDKSLNISYATFRDKTEPGAKEKFIIHIKNNDSSNANAELLSAMYDGSLDALYKQNWRLPYFNNYGNVYNRWNAAQQFGNVYGRENYIVDNNYIVNKVYDELIFGDLYNNGVIPYRNLKYYFSGVGKTYIYRKEALAAPSASIDKLVQGKVAGISINGNESLNDVVVVGYGVQRKQALTGATQNIQIRGTNSVTNNNPIYVVDGVVVNDINNIPASDIISTSVLKGEQATALYGSQAVNGVVVIVTKNGAQQTANVQPRTNFNETAFFYPQLHADKNGNYNIEFTMPDAVTSWRWMNLAYDKNLSFGYSEKNILSQKTLMVQPNVPRFLRAGDSIYLSAKISNLSDKTLSGNATIELINPMNNGTITSWNINSNAAFSVAANQSTSVLFPVNIPKDYTEPLSIIIKASAGNYSDGEQHDVVVLSNRMLVTESLPLFMKGDGTKSYSFEKLKNNQSKTLQNNSVTVEYTSNPVWYAVQSLPYLIQYPYECAEQTFNKLYANALGMYIVKSNPAIQNTFNQWLKDTTALQSNLEKNQELKTLLLNETPWVADAESEATQKRNVANLFDAEKMNEQLTSLLSRLKELQLSSGGFAWFKGGHENRYITQYIVTGIGKLMQLNSLPKNYLSQLSNVSDKALTYLKIAIDEDYSDLVKNKIDLTKNNLSSIQMQYLLAKSYFDNRNNLSKAENYFYQQEKKYWTNQSNYFKSMIALTAYRHGDKTFAINQPVKSVLENAVEDSAKGMYWKDNEAGYFWYQAPIEQQSLIIDALNEIGKKENNAVLKNAVADMQQWLIINKQTNSWKTTKATADACYALLNANKNLNIDKRNVAIQLGNETIQPDKTEAGTGYFKDVIKGRDVKNDMGNITVNVSSPNSPLGDGGNSPSYGSVYWQYFEDMDKITTAATNLSIHKKLFIEKNTDEGKKLFAVNDGDAVNIGDKLVCRIEIKTDRDMEFVHLKDMRASSMEPDNVLSSYKWQDGLGYYESTKDASTDFFFDMLRKGTYVFDYPVHITHSGRFSSGIATIECMYASGFSSHSEGFVIRVNEK